MATLAYAAFDSVSLILAGGSDGAPLSVVGYGLVTLLIAIGLVVALPRVAPRSELAAAEAAQWRAGAVLSAHHRRRRSSGSRRGRPRVAPGRGLRRPGPRAGGGGRARPGAVAAAPRGRREILEAAPPPEVRGAIDAAVERTRAEYDLGVPFVRATKLGRRLYVEVDFEVTAGEWDVAEEDRVRRHLIDGLSSLELEIWANVELTTDPDLAR